MTHEQNARIKSQILSRYFIPGIAQAFFAARCGWRFSGEKKRDPTTKATTHIRDTYI